VPAEFMLVRYWLSQGYYWHFELLAVGYSFTGSDFATDVEA